MTDAPKKDLGGDLTESDRRKLRKLAGKAQ